MHQKAFVIHPLNPFRLDFTVWALRRRPENLIDRWDGKAYRRTLVIKGHVHEVTVTQHEANAPLRVRVSTVHPHSGTPQEIRDTLEAMLGIREDLAGFYHLAERDKRLAPLAERFKGMKPPRFPSAFEGLVNGIACQQLSLTVGIRVLNRLAERFGLWLQEGDSSGYAFPRPEELAAATPQQIRELGFNLRKAQTIIAISQAVAEGGLDLEGLKAMSDEEAVRRLIELRGVGRWTAEYTLLRGMGRWHIFPVDDVGARNGLRQWFRLRKPLNAEGAGLLLTRWKPYAGLLYFHMLLRGLEQAAYLDLASPLGCGTP